MRCQTQLLLLILLASALATMPTNALLVKPPPGTNIIIPLDTTIHFGDAWIANYHWPFFPPTGSEMNVSAFWVNNWFNFTVTSHGLEYIYNGSKPSAVFVDGVEYPEDSAWAYDDDTVAILYANHNASIYYGLIETDNPPYYYPSSISYNTTEVSTPCKFTAKWNDDNGLSKYIFSTNNTGSWVNDTATAFTTLWANVTKTLNATPGLVIGFRWYANDTANQWNVTSTGILDLTLTDTGYPTVSTITYTPTTIDTSCTFTSLWTDDVELSTYLFSYDLGTGTFTNSSWTAFSSTPGTATASKTLPSTLGAIIRFIWYASDSAGHITKTSTYQFLTTGETPPEPEEITGTQVTYYMRNNLVTVNGQVGYELNPNKPSGNSPITLNGAYTDTADKVITWGWRVWTTNQLNQTRELTHGIPTAFLIRSLNGSGWQTSTYTVPTTTLTVGYSAIKVIVYLRFGYTGSWTAKAVFTTPRILEKALTTSTWTFNVWTKAEYTTVVADHTSNATLKFGSATYDTNIDNVLFHEPSGGEIQLYLYGAGQWFTAMFYPWTQTMGTTFYTFIMLLIGITLYRRGHDINVILIVFVLFGGSTGILTVLTPVGALNIAWLFLVIPLAILFFKLFRDRI